MFKKIMFALITIGMVLIFMGVGWGTPHYINYQGKLTDSDNIPVPDLERSMIFRIFDDPSTGNQLWTETKDVTTEAGFFNTLLGDTSTLNSWIFTYEATYLEVQVSGDTAMTPRQQIVSVGYAYNADMLDGKHASEFLTQGTTDDLYVNETGDKMIGPLTVEVSSDYGVDAQTDSTSGRAVYGRATATSGKNYGVYGETASPNGYGMYARDSSSSIFAALAGGSKRRAVIGRSDSEIAIYGQSTTAEAGRGVHGDTSSNNGYGVYGTSYGSGGVGVYGYAPSGQGVYGKYNDNIYGFIANASYAVYGRNTNAAGYTVYGSAPYGATAVYGQTTSGKGVAAQATGGTAVYAQIISEPTGEALVAMNEASGNSAKLGIQNYAGYFVGPVNIVGSCTATSFHGDGSQLTGVEAGLTQEAADDLYVNETGDTMTGILTMSAGVFRSNVSNQLNAIGFELRTNNEINTDDGSSFPGAYLMSVYSGASKTVAAMSVFEVNDIPNSVFYDGCGVPSYRGAPGLYMIVGEIEGNSVAMMGDAVNDSLINFEDGGAQMRLRADKIVIQGDGVTTVEGSPGVHIPSNLIVSQIATLGGASTYIGSNTGDSLSVTARVASDFVPDFDNTRSLGTPSLGWIFYGDGSNLTGISPAGDFVLKAGDQMYGPLTVETSAGNRAVYGNHTGAGAVSNFGGMFISAGDSGTGVYGGALASGAVQNFGGDFYAAGNSGRAVSGNAAATGAVQNYGGYFLAGGNSGRAVYGETSSATGANYGGYFTAAGGSGTGVYGVASATGDVMNYGGYFETAGNTGEAVYGNAYATGDISNKGGHFVTAGQRGIAVYGQATQAGSYANYGGWFNANGDSGRGVYGECGGSAGRGIEGSAFASGAGVQNFGGYFIGAGDSGYGLRSEATAFTGTTYGGYFQVNSPSGKGLLARNSSGAMYYAELGTGSHAGYFYGPVNITGVCTAQAFYGDGSNLTGIEAGLTQEAADDLYVNVPGDTMTGTLTMSAGVFRSNVGHSSGAHGFALRTNTELNNYDAFGLADEFVLSVFSGSSATQPAFSVYQTDVPAQNMYYRGIIIPSYHNSPDFYILGGDINTQQMVIVGNPLTQNEITFNADNSMNIKSSHLIVDTNIASFDCHAIPKQDNEFDLGSPYLQWRDVYAVNFHGDGSDLTGIGGGGLLTTAEADTRYVNITGDTMTGTLTISASGNLQVDGLIDGTNMDLSGTATLNNIVYMNDAVYLGNTSGNSIYVNGSILTDIVPNGNHDLGVVSPNWQRWGDVYAYRFHGYDHLTLYGAELYTSSSEGRAVYGYASHASGENFGGYFQSNSSNGRGVFGLASMTGGGISYGGYFQSNSWGGRGVYATATGSTGRGVHGVASATGSVTTYGGYFETKGDLGTAVYGSAESSASTTNYGGYFTAYAESGRGVYGGATNPSGTANYGGYFEAYGTAGRGVRGVATDTGATSANYGGEFEAAGQQGRGVNGFASSSTGANYGGRFVAAGDSGRGVYGFATSSTGTTFGGFFQSNSSNGYGIYASASSGLYAGYFYGKLYCLSSIEAAQLYVSGTKNFLIDHPLDPANKTLKHAAIEAPEMKNVYDGTVILDNNGEAIVDLPSYFEALNKDYRYQLTTIGDYAPVYIKEEVKENKFKIAGGKPGMKISWQVTGIRHDAYAKDHPYVVEENKKKKGEYLYPEGFK